MIEVRELTKKYGELVAVRDLTFKVEAGRIWGLLGPNAAGKTTTMRILTGYLPATSGRATVAGFDVFEQPNDVKRSIGYLPEVVPLYLDMTVASYLAFVAEIKQVPKAGRKAAVARVIESAGLADVSRRLIKNISRGFKQRVGIAQAMIHDPKVLVLDEPTIGLDPAQIREIRELIRGLRGEHTILLSTHILPEVTQVCDGVVIINQGRLMASGSLDDLAASFEKNDGVLLRLRRGGAEEAALFRGIPGVEKVAVEGDEIRVEWGRGRDLRDDVARLVLDKGLGLKEMRSVGRHRGPLHEDRLGRARTMTEHLVPRQKGVRAYFSSPIAYVVIAGFLLLVGFFFYSLISWFNAQAMQMAQNPYYAQQININEMVFSPLVPQHDHHPHPRRPAPDHAAPGRGEEERHRRAPLHLAPVGRPDRSRQVPRRPGHAGRSCSG